MDIYHDLLEATIGELRGMQARGVRHVTVDPNVLKSLANRMAPSPVPTPAQRPTAPAAPAPVSTSAPAPVILTPISGGKADALRELRERASVCQKCQNLAAARKNVVFGVGNIDADLMFVGEAPGADEDVQGEPFVGRAGQLLTKIIQTMGLAREQVYIANILKCRPDTPGQAAGNRPPTPDEMERCLPYLHAQIDLVKPKAIVALGSTAVDGLFGKVPGLGITKMRGKWREYRGIPVMPTYHPSYLLRPNVNNVKREAWEDMLQVMERLGIPISEKQRGYFLSKG